MRIAHRAIHSSKLRSESSLTANLGFVFITLLPTNVGDECPEVPSFAEVGVGGDDVQMRYVDGLLLPRIGKLGECVDDLVYAVVAEVNVGHV